MPDEPVPPPLSTVTVIAFEHAVAVPYCTRILADLGARVIKVEPPGRGDFTRHYDHAVEGLGSHFVWLNRNKRSLALDCKHPAARAVLDRLLDRADVVVQNLAPGAARRLGLDARSLVRDRPRIVAVDLSGYGTGGPLDHRRAYDLLIQAEAGSCAITGTAIAPAKAGIPVADVGSGLQAAVGVLAALLARQSTGRGAAIEVSMFDTTVDFLASALIHYRYTGQDRPPIGMSSQVVAPYGAFPTRDGHQVVLGTTNDGEWQRFARQLLERADLADDPQLAGTEQRCLQRARLDGIVSGWTAERDLADILARADAAGIGNAVFNRLDTVVGHPQLVERGRWIEVDSPAGLVAGLRPVLSGDWPLPLAPIPALGQHTDEVLGELGLSDAEIAALRTAGAL